MAIASRATTVQVIAAGTRAGWSALADAGSAPMSPALGLESLGDSAPESGSALAVESLGD
jgi:hypothetical protein